MGTKISRSKNFLIMSLVALCIFFLFFSSGIIKTRSDFDLFNRPIQREDRFKKFFQFLEYTNNRKDYWNNAIEIIKDHVIFGVGYNAYSLVSRDYTNAYKREYGGYPHNCYLQMTAEIGLIGLSSFFWIIFVLYSNSLRNIRKFKDKITGILSLGFLSGLIGFFVHSFWDTLMYSVQLSALMWLMMGIIVAIQKIELEGDCRTKEASA